MPTAHPCRPLLALLGLCIATSASALDIAGASTIQPLVAKLIPLYTGAGGEPVKLSAGGSGVGIKAASSGAAHIGMVSRAVKPEEAAVLKHRTIGIDALAVIVHRANPVTALSKQQVVDLYAGRVTNWREVGGADLAVRRVTKEVGRSTLELFEHYTGLVSADRPKSDGKPQISKDSFVIGSNLESLTLVGGMPGAVGYVSFGTAEALAKAGMPVKIVVLDKVAPSAASIQSRSYPLVRELNLVWRDDTAAVRAFLELTLSDAGQSEVRAQGFVPVSR